MPQQSQLKPLPAPLQAANRTLCKLEPFRNPQPFHPEYDPVRRRGHYEPSTLCSGNLFIGEKVLQFDRACHADGLKSVTRLPVPQPDWRTDLVRVETLLPQPSLGPRSASRRIDPPPDSRPVKLNLTHPVTQINLRRARAKFLRIRNLQMYPTQSIAHGIT